jgi:hypothetical protein
LHCAVGVYYQPGALNKLSTSTDCRTVVVDEGVIDLGFLGVDSAKGVRVGTRIDSDGDDLSLDLDRAISHTIALPLAEEEDSGEEIDNDTDGGALHLGAEVVDGTEIWDT